MFSHFQKRKKERKKENDSECDVKRFAFCVLMVDLRCVRRKMEEGPSWRFFHCNQRVIGKITRSSIYLVERNGDVKLHPVLGCQVHLKRLKAVDDQMIPLCVRAGFFVVYFKRSFNHVFEANEDTHTHTHKPKLRPKAQNAPGG